MDEGKEWGRGKRHERIQKDFDYDQFYNHSYNPNREFINLKTGERYKPDQSKSQNNHKEK